MQPVTPPRVIADFSVDVPEHWYRVPTGTEVAGRTWARELAARLTTEQAATSALTAHLDSLREWTLRLEKPGMTSAVYVPQPDFGRASALLGFEVSDIALESSPGAPAASYLADLQAEAASASAGMTVRSFDSWREPVDAGELVGAHSVLAHGSLLEGEGGLEERCVYGVFPTNCAEMVQFVFSTRDFSAFGSMPEETQAIVSTLRVSLEQS